MNDTTDLEKRLRALLPVASNIDRLLVSVTDLRTLLDALTAVREPVGDVGEVVKRLQKANEYEPLGHDGWEAADLLTRQAAEIERFKKKHAILSANFTLEGYEEMERVAAANQARAEAAEAERDEAVGVLETAPVVAVACDMKCKECDCGFKPWDDCRQAFLAKLETKP